MIDVSESSRARAANVGPVEHPSRIDAFNRGYLATAVVEPDDESASQCQGTFTGRKPALHART